MMTDLWGYVLINIKFCIFAKSHCNCVFVCEANQKTPTTPGVDKKKTRGKGSFQQAIVTREFLVSFAKKLLTVTS